MWFLHKKLNLNKKHWFYWTFMFLFRICEILCTAIPLDSIWFYRKIVSTFVTTKNRKEHGYKNDNSTTTQIFISTIREHCLWIIFQAFLYIGRLFLCPFSKIIEYQKNKTENNESIFKHPTKTQITFEESGRSPIVV